MNKFENPQVKKEKQSEKRYNIRDDKSIDPDIRDLYLPTRKLFKDIKERVVNREYFLIIGDDASGRIPALIFDELIRNEYKKQNREKEHPKLIFIAGSRFYSYGDASFEEKERKVFDLIEKELKQNKIEGKRVLVVTDTVETGRSLLPVVHSLKKLNVDFDVVSTSGGTNSPHYSARNEFDKNLFVYKKEGATASAIYGRSGLSGVEKGVFDLHSRTTRTDQFKDVDKSFNEQVGEARRGAHKLARFLIEEEGKK